MQRRFIDIRIRGGEYPSKILTLARLVRKPIGFDSPVISPATSPAQHTALGNEGSKSKPITPTIQKNICRSKLLTRRK